MALSPNKERYLVVTYAFGTDTQTVASLAEYETKHNAEKHIQDRLDNGVPVENIRVFKARECSICTKEATIEDG